MSKMLEDTQGNQSTMRAAVIATVASVLAVFVLSNAAMMVKALFQSGAINIVDFEPQMIWALGVALGAKSIQKFGEK